jgi:16S rRNA G966 N2-methylase RsmD
MEQKVIYYDKLFPIYDNNKDILKKVKIDNDSISFISSPIYAEKISKIIINHTKTNKINVTDCTAGCGGDTLSFLHKFKKVYSIERNLLRYNYLLNNIQAYKLAKYSRIYCGNFLNIIKQIEDHDVLYIDPPWGGRNYKKYRNLKLSINNIPLESVITDLITNKETKKVPNFIVLKLPNNYDLKHLYDKLKDYGKLYFYNLKKMLIIVFKLNQQRSSSEVNPSSTEAEASPESPVEICESL